MVGEALGHYRVIEKIGSGGMGEVYRAHDDQLDRDVALKVLPAGTLANEATRKLFRKEALVLAKLNHPNIATIHEFGSQDGVDFLAMELIPGKALKEILREGPLEEKQVQRLGLQLADGLSAAHEHGVVHCDLKPGNIMVTREGRLKILDFGLAKLMQSGGQDMTQSATMRDGMAGTLPYMAPERLRGEAADERTDVYATGTVLYEMTTGQRPFPDTNSARLVDSILHRMPRPPCELNRRLSPAMQAIVLRTLEKDPEDRYHSLREVHLELERLSVTATDVRPSVSLGQSPLPRMVRWSWLAVVGGFLALATVALVVPRIRDSVFHIFSGRVSPPAGIPSLGEWKSLAVLPFDVQGDRSTLGYIAEGLDQELARKLLALPSLHVVSPRDAEAQAKRQSVDLGGPLETVARNLGANLIVKGTVSEEAGGWAQINIELNDVPDRRQLLNLKRHDAAADMKLLDLEDEVYEQIVKRLKLKPSSEEQKRAARPTSSNDAFDQYLKGNNALLSHTGLAGVDVATGFYEQALQEDPQFAIVHASLSRAYLMRYRETKDTTWIHKALQSARQAQKLNNDLPEVHLALGAAYRQLGKTDEAIGEFKLVKQLLPSSDQPWLLLGRSYEDAGQKDQAIDAYRKAILASPYSLVDQNELGAVYVKYGEYEQALGQFRRVIEIDADNYLGHMNIGAVYLYQSKYEECIPELKRALELHPDADIYSNLGTAYFSLKKYGQSVEMNEKAASMRPNDYMIIGNLADAYRWSRRKEKATETYDRAVALANEQLDMNPRSADVLGSLALYYAKRGNSQLAADCIRRARLVDSRRADLMYDEATVRILAKQPEQAMESLKLAFENHVPPEQALSDPEFSGLQGNPDFQKLVKQYSAKSN